MTSIETHNTKNPIRTVSVVSTGTVDIRPQHVQARGLLRRHIDLPGQRWRSVTPQPTTDPTSPSASSLRS